MTHCREFSLWLFEDSSYFTQSPTSGAMLGQFVLAPGPGNGPQPEGLRFLGARGRTPSIRLCASHWAWAPDVARVNSAAGVVRWPLHEE